MTDKTIPESKQNTIALDGAATLELKIPNDEFMPGSYINRGNLEWYLRTSKRARDHWERAVVRGYLELFDKYSEALRRLQELGDHSV